ncbi:TetR family transcriptional regulator [Williamsia sp. 1138]|uniref:TetR/AcrR family transcriptional regulator n=1 Tax=Williamsia sp. 1138 TaxID=1903117 RepID=UPI000A10F81E|nr:TetR/AcrR family transcriptional regulator [Williamsia sp. 1138]OZG29331.1 TetR family transcriptional regulator [Williamsia sp. 1138]
MTIPNEEPAWKQRAVERSIKTAKVRAEQRVQKFLDAAQAIIAERGTTEFTVQEVVDRSKQSLRSFYLQFDGKHELLLALLEDTIGRSTDQIRASTSEQTEPIRRLEVAVQSLFDICRPDLVGTRPLLGVFAPQLLLTHPAEVRVAHAPLLALFTELMDAAAVAGDLHPDANPAKMASMTTRTVMFLAQSSAGDEASQRIDAAEVWQFCVNGFAISDDRVVTD